MPQEFINPKIAYFEAQYTGVGPNPNVPATDDTFNIRASSSCLYFGKYLSIPKRVPFIVPFWKM